MAYLMYTLYNVQVYLSSKKRYIIYTLDTFYIGYIFVGALLIKRDAHIIIHIIIWKERPNET